MQRVATVAQPESAAMAAMAGPETPTAATAAIASQRREPARVRPATRMPRRWPEMAATPRPDGLLVDPVARAATAAVPGMAFPARRRPTAAMETEAAPPRARRSAAA